MLTLVISVVLARKLSVEAYGLFVFGFAFPSWFLLLVTLGLDEVICTDVAADRSRADAYLTLVALVRVPLALVALAGLWLATRAVLMDPEAVLVTMILGTSTILSALGSTFISTFRAFEKFEYATLVVIVERVVTTTIVVLLVLAGFGLLVVSLAYLAGSSVTPLFAGVLVHRRFANFTKRINPTTLVLILKRATPFAVFNAVGTFSFSLSVVLLTILRDPASTGLFNAAFTLLLGLFSFLSLFSIAALPMMARVHSESRERLAAILHRIQRLSIIFGVPLAFGGWFFADAIVIVFYGNAFAASAESFRVLVLAFSIETVVLGNGPALAATGHARQKLYAGASGAATIGAACWLLIPPYGPIGAAAAFLAGNVLTAVLGFLMVRRYVAPIGEFDTLAKSLLAGIAMLFALYAIPGLSLWTGLAVGGLVYFLALGLLGGASRTDGAVVWEGIRGALLR